MPTPHPPPHTFSFRAFLSQTEFATASASFAPYDQYEVSIPLDRAGTCLEEVGAEIYGPAKLYEGLRTPGLIRFVNGEEYYLSTTNGGPRMYINIEVGLLLLGEERMCERRAFLPFARAGCLTLIALV